MVKAIETEYAGYKFRSRLEARWAVFFDAMGIQWEYEQEGFELEDGTKYLPDFYLPEMNAYVEIKGIGAIRLEFSENEVEFINGREDASKYAYFTKSIYKDHLYIILIGDPWNALLKKEHGAKGGGYVFTEGECVFKITSEDEPELQCVNSDVKCVDCKNFKSMCSYNILGFTEKGVVIPIVTDVLPFYIHYGKEISMIFFKDGKAKDGIGEDDRKCFEKNIKAIMAARQARFEYGETPKR